MPYRRTEQVSDRLAERRRKILRATREIVATSGFAGLSVQEVSRMCDVATGTVYRYFPSKDALSAEMLSAVADRELEVLRHITADNASAHERLWVVVHTFTLRALRARTLAYALMGEPVEAGLVGLRIHYRSQLSELVANLIEQGIQSGQFPPQEPATRAAYIVGAFIEGVIGPHAPQRSAGAHLAQAEDIASFCLRALGAKERIIASIRRRHSTTSELPSIQFANL
jgi:AcrR family transcriptional regulator